MNDPALEPPVPPDSGGAAVAAVDAPEAASESRPRAVTVRRAALALAASLALVVGMDSLVFRTELYRSVLRVDSSTGRFESVYESVVRLKPDGRQRVLCVGDSRLPVLPKIADRTPEGKRFRFLHAGVPGTTPRAWYYLLRDLDPTGRRFAAVVIAVDDYDDEDDLSPYDDWISDLRFAVFRLRWSDLIEFPLSYPAGSMHRWQAFRGALLKGTVLAKDFQQFLADPVGRYNLWQQASTDFGGWAYDALPSEDSLAGLQVDWAAKRVTAYPPGFREDLKKILEGAIFRPEIPQTGAITEYRRKWFGKIVDRYANSRTKVIFARFPRMAIIPPGWDSRRKSGRAIRDLAARPNVLLFEERAFEYLEKPEFSHDGVHLNLEGASRATRTLAEGVVRMLAARPGA